MVAALALVLLRPWDHGSDEGQPVGRGVACPAVATGPKSPLHGLLPVGEPPADSADVPTAGWSVNVPWSDLQPQPGGALVSPNPIDTALQQLRARRTSCEQGLKLRVFAGVNAPEWAKQLGGSPVSLAMTTEDRKGAVPRFWTPEFGRAYDALQAALAARYDGVAEIREIVISRCTTFYAESMLRQVRERENLDALRGAGWTPEADRTCLQEQVASHLSWRLTPSSLALNPYQTEDGEGRLRGNLAVAQEAALRCRAVLGSRCILANNSIRYPSQTPLYDELYAFLQAQGGPLEFQAAAPSRLRDPVRTLQRAIQLGAGSVEMSPLIVDGRDRDLAPVVAAWQDPARPGSASPSPPG